MGLREEKAGLRGEQDLNLSLRSEYHCVCNSKYLPLFTHSVTLHGARKGICLQIVRKSTVSRDEPQIFSNVYKRDLERIQPTTV
jgi:hypothetical protein